MDEPMDAVIWEQQMDRTITKNMFFTCTQGVIDKSHRQQDLRAYESQYLRNCMYKYVNSTAVLMPVLDSEMNKPM